jgi:6-phosphogluconolactonase (cycloisomerase 2 family)
VSIDDDNPALSWTFDPQGRFAYVASPFSQSIYSFAVNGESGALQAIGEPLLVGPAPDHRLPAFVAADPSGHFVYVTQLADPAAPANDNGIRGYRVNQETGALSELPESPFGEGGVVAGAIAFRPDGQFLFSSGGALNAYAIDPDSGNLSLVEGSPFTTDVGSDPWAINLAVTPQGDFVYVSHFLPTQHVSGFAIDPESGALQAVPGSPITTGAPYSIAIDPTGRFLLVGDDSGHVPAYSLSRDDGSLSALEGSPFPFGGLEPEFAFATRP